MAGNRALTMALVTAACIASRAGATWPAKRGGSTIRTGPRASGATEAVTVMVCTHKTCRREGARDSLQNFQHVAASLGAQRLVVEEVGCLGQCGKGPNVAAFRAGSEKVRTYHDVFKPATIAAIVEVESGCEVREGLVTAQANLMKAKRFLTADRVDDALRMLDACIAGAGDCPPLLDAARSLRADIAGRPGLQEGAAEG